LKRRLSILVAAAALTLAALASTGLTSAGAASGGGCQLAGTASFSPGLTNTAGNFTYSFSGALTSCQSTIAGSPATGTISAGQVVTAASGEQFQEPVPSGNGTCANGTTSGIAIITWADGTQSVISYATTSAGALVDQTGTVIASVTLPAINPAVGQPTSETITTTRYAGDSALSALTFQADPTQCSTAAGVTTAAIGGVSTLSTTN
jgi:hypothetical protein